MPADGVVTGYGEIGGRRVCVADNVKCKKVVIGGIGESEVEYLTVCG